MVAFSNNSFELIVNHLALNNTIIKKLGYLSNLVDRNFERSIKLHNSGLNASSNLILVTGCSKLL